MKIKVLQFIPGIIWFIIANILFLMPGPDVPSISFLDEIYFDKWVHAGLFCARSVAIGAGRVARSGRWQDRGCGFILATVSL